MVNFGRGIFLIFPSFFSAFIRGILSFELQNMSTILPVGSGWYCMTFDGDRFVSIGSSTGTSRVAWSDDIEGRTFGATNISVNGYFVAIEYNGSVYLAMRIDGTCATSPDRTTWTEQTAIPVSLNNGFLKVIGNTFFACPSGTAAIYTSTDGVSWTTHVTPQQFIDIAYNGIYYCALDDNNNRIYRSTDLSTWGYATLPSSQPPKGIVAVGTKFYCISYDNPNMQSFTSIDSGATWVNTLGGFYTGNASVRGIKYSKGLFYTTMYEELGFPQSFFALVSRDAITWNQALTPPGDATYFMRKGINGWAVNGRYFSAPLAPTLDGIPIFRVKGVVR